MIQIIITNIYNRIEQIETSVLSSNVGFC